MRVLLRRAITTSCCTLTQGDTGQTARAPSAAAPAVPGRVKGSTWSKSLFASGSEPRMSVGLVNHPAQPTWRLHNATQRDLDPASGRETDRALHLDATKASEMAPCPVFTCGTGTHTVVQPEQEPSACRESRRAATLRTPRCRCAGRLPSAACIQVRLRSESPRVRTTADASSILAASIAGGVGELAVSGYASSLGSR